MSARIGAGESLISDLLHDQQQLHTAAGIFSRWHESAHDEPLQKRHYRDLIPLSKPGAGEQHAFEVNLDDCTGCKACVAACHSLNGLDENESWRDVGTVTGIELPHTQTITTACHHCADPACSNGCPVLAYEKDAETGIVRHLDDQCIGCSYCIMKCPYDVPKLNVKRGIVRKCDMCQGRLAAGEAPACVQACPNEAITIRIVSREQSAKSGERLLPGAFDSGYTRPMTKYVSEKPLPESWRSALDGKARTEEPHTPLAIMLVLTQLAAGGFLFSESKAQSWVAFAALQVGLIASVLHLGQPLKAWRSFLGWRKSWLSREIIAFGLFAAAGASALMGLISPMIAGGAGAAGVFCSVMVYADTRRSFWSFGQTSAKFFSTLFLLGFALAAGMTGHAHFVFGTLAVAAAKLLFEGSVLIASDERLRLSATLLAGPLRMLTAMRFAIGIAGAVLMLVQPWFGLLLLITGEMLERSLFFRAGVAWRMPGL